MSLAARLRDIARGANPAASPGESPRRLGVRAGDPGSRLAPRNQAADPADVLEGEWHEAKGHRYLVIDRTYWPGYRHGRLAVADALPPVGGWPSLDMLGGRRSEGPDDPGLLFLDLETTGLAGGAGTYAFLIGCAWFEPPSPAASTSANVGPSRPDTAVMAGQSAVRPVPADRSAGRAACLRVRQFFLSSYVGERVVLEALAGLARGAATLVTYNGKTFDVPLIDTRFLLHRLQTPFADLAHVDMLHAARRLWRGEQNDVTEGSCRLIALEQGLLGHAREGDVPGFEIPSRYFHYVRSGDAGPLRAVLEHNRLDLLTLALMTARAASLLDEGSTAAATGREALGVGRLYERASRMAEACLCFARAATFAGDPLTQAEALRALAVACRRARRFDEAAEAWQRLLALPRCPPRFVREAAEALAIHHEHRVRDLPQALAFASRLMDTHRLKRLTRKLGLPRLPVS